MVYRSISGHFILRTSNWFWARWSLWVSAKAAKNWWVNCTHVSWLSSKGRWSLSHSPMCRPHSWTRGPWISVRARAILVRKDWYDSTRWLSQKYVFNWSTKDSALVQSPSNTVGSCPIGRVMKLGPHPVAAAFPAPPGGGPGPPGPLSSGSSLSLGVWGLL